MPYPDQVASLTAEVRALLPDTEWLETFTGPDEGFRNKAKLVVGGVKGQPTLGILGPDQRGVDLRHCGIHEPALAAVIPRIADFIADAGLTPYDVSTRSGELKHVLVTHSPTGEFLTRFVLRSEGQLRRIDPARLPAGVVTVNLQPDHKAVIEGPTEMVLTEQQTLPMPINDVLLHLGPRSFFQTNTTVAAGLYAQAREWIDGVAPNSVLDLYCGVGGFAHHAAAPGRSVHGVEISAEAIACARLGGSAATFSAGEASLSVAVDLVVVNPPRRGIGSLAEALEHSEVPTVLYSSCNPETLARDLRVLSSYEVTRGRVFDMFPQTGHAEVLVLLRRLSA